ncbi:MAG: aminotransferase-like domain-containing protein [Rhodospirillales bacterium]
MTSWTPVLSGIEGLQYERLADAIAEAVRTGELRPGAKLPPQRDLAWKLGMAVGTVSRAYQLAEQRRLVSGHVGRGTYVLDPGSDQGDGEAGGAIDLTRNIPHVASHVPALAAALNEIARMPGLGTLLNYMPEAGHPRYRAAGAKWIARVGLAVEPERLVLTGGSQHGLAISLLALARPGDTVLTERLTFHGVPEAVAMGGAKCAGVALDEEGAVPDDLDRAARASGAKLVFLTPTVHSPTTALMSQRRRRAIAQVIQARGMVLIEDDVYGYLPTERPAPIAALIPERTIYIASASKCLAPGLRVAWMAAPAALRDRLGAALHATALGLPALGPEIVTRWIENGTAARLVAEQRQEAAARHALAADALKGLSWRGRPDALHAFIHLPGHWRDDQFAAEAHRRGVVVCPAREFAVDGKDAPNAFRATLGAPRDQATLKRALEALAQLALSAPSQSAETARRRVV